MQIKSAAAVPLEQQERLEVGCPLLWALYASRIWELDVLQHPSHPSNVSTFPPRDRERAGSLWEVSKATVLSVYGTWVKRTALTQPTYMPGPLAVTHPTTLNRHDWLLTQWMLQLFHIFTGCCSRIWRNISVVWLLSLLVKKPMCCGWSMLILIQKERQLLLQPDGNRWFMSPGPLSEPSDWWLASRDPGRQPWGVDTLTLLQGRTTESRLWLFSSISAAGSPVNTTLAQALSARLEAYRSMDVWRPENCKTTP